MAARRRPDQLRVGSALILWGALALAGWLMVLVPVWLAVTRGSEIIADLFDDDAKPATTETAGDPTGDPALLRRLNEIAPAAGRSGDAGPKK